MPRWLVIIAYVVGLGFLLFASMPSPARFIFPLWVLLVSIYLLIVSFCRSKEQEAEEEQEPHSSEKG